MREQILRLGKNSMIYGAGTMLTRFINLLLLPLFTAYLTPTDYGVLALLALLGSLAQPVFSLGLGAGMGPCYFDGNSESRKAASIWTAFVLLLGSTSILGMAAWVFSRQLSQLMFQTPGYNWLVAISLAGTALYILSIPFTSRLQFEERAVPFVVLTLVSTLASILLSILVVVFLGWGVRGMVLSQVLGYALNLALFMSFVCRQTRLRVDWAVGTELLRLSLPLVPSFAFLFILLQSNRYILQWFRGLHDVGVYSVGFSLGMAMSVAVGALQTAWYPYFMSYMDRREEATHLFGRIFTYYVYGFGGLCLLFFIAARLIVLTMTRPSFHEAYMVVGFSATAQFLAGLFSLSLPSIYFAKEVKYVNLVQGGAAVLAVLLNMALVPALGLLGAGIALPAGFLTMVVLLQVWNAKRRRTYLRINYEWTRLLKFAGLFVVFAGVSLYRRDWSLRTEVALSTGTTFALVLAFLALLSDHERSVVRHLAFGVLLRRFSRESGTNSLGCDEGH